jgi:thiamine-phosphate diphosphorylase
MGPLGHGMQNPLKRRIDARLMWIFTPDPERPEVAEAALAAALPCVDAIQVRLKLPGRKAGPSPAGPLLDWTRRVLHLRERLPSDARRPWVLVNDRADVARALADEGLDGLHLGDRDLAPEAARAYLPEGLLLGLSTHSHAEVLAAQDRPVDYLGFGPVFATATKGYDRGLGPERAWIAQEGSGLPVFPIGGIDLANAEQLEEVGRAAVGSAITDASDPAAAAEHLRAALGGV